jgi:exopolyphosphatase/pppGpp-phosphohydrolase
MIDEDVSFPLRVASVDMGSNAIRFLFADVFSRKVRLRFAGDEVDEHAAVS